MAGAWFREDVTTGPARAVSPETAVARNRARRGRILSSMAPTTGRPPKTVDDYMALPDDVRAELIGGICTRPRHRHRATRRRCNDFCLALAPFLEAEGLGRIYLAGRAYRPAGHHEGRVRSPLLPGLTADVERLLG